MRDNVCIRCSELSQVFMQRDVLVYAVRNCNMQICTGDFCAVIGGKGAGKSMLLQSLAGYARPTLGTVFINGVDIYRMREARLAQMRHFSLGAVFLPVSLSPILSARKNVLLAVKNSANLSMPYVSDLFDVLDMNDFLEQPVAELSEAQKVRIAIARVMVNRPEILILDEPTKWWEREPALALTEQLLQLNRLLGTTVVFSTDDEEQASRASCRFSMENGIVREE